MKSTLAMLLTLGLAVPAAASAGHEVRLFTGHTVELDRHHDSRHRHGPQCHHRGGKRHHRRGPGCREVGGYARLPDGGRIPVERTLCRDRHGRHYYLPNGTRIIRRDRFRY